MPRKNLAQGESITVETPENFSAVAAVTTGSTNHAGANMVLEAQVDNEWVTPLTLVNPLANPKTEVAALTGASKAGWADVPGFRAVRVRRTDANGGDGWAELNVAKG